MMNFIVTYLVSYVFININSNNTSRPNHSFTVLVEFSKQDFFKTKRLLIKQTQF